MHEQTVRALADKLFPSTSQLFEINYHLKKTRFLSSSFLLSARRFGAFYSLPYFPFSSVAMLLRCSIAIFLSLLLRYSVFIEALEAALLLAALLGGSSLGALGRSTMVQNSVILRHVINYIPTSLKE